MKYLGSHIFRSICCVCVGLLLAVNATAMGILIVQIVGGIFLTSAVVTLLTWLWNRLSSTVVKPALPIMALGSLGFGALLLAFPAGVIAYMVTILGILLVIGAVSQLSAIFSYRRIAPMSVGGFIVPIALLALGLYICIEPMETVDLSLQLLGVAIAVYGFSDLFMAIRFARYNRVYTKRKEEEERQERIKREMQYVDFEVVDATKEENRE